MPTIISRVTYITFIAASIIVLGCSQEKESHQNEVSEKKIAFEELEPFLTFEEDSLAQPIDIDILDDNKIAVLDNKLASVFFYDKQGEPITKVGQKGKGPGEFGRPLGLQVANNKVYVLDFATVTISIISKEGEFLERYPYKGEMMSFAQLAVEGKDKYLVPANGTEGALIRYQHSADSSLYFGDAPGEKGETFNLQEIKKTIKNREVPDVFKNTALTAYDDESFYAFLQSYGKVQRYSREGALLWETTIDLPVKEDIFDYYIERNKNQPNNAVYPLAYATDMKVTPQGIFILMNVPNGKEQVLLKMDEKGQLQTIYRVGSGDGGFNAFSLMPSSAKLFLMDASMGSVYEVTI
ncbi:6-bladed beta-propeller [Fodinibius halophilus]|uniref:6-bladed beta-propeller n=1 Tax=Fodinibius halophilus TaxID=1736908 RepID=A0A6M1T0R9_9BACT|nr:6-bladed beta-propeller [Fodinibius halophilus]NGP87547.1 6-bladed beta-propeller [Fodinibius halophilus]